jgi:hypothetical protein
MPCELYAQFLPFFTHIYVVCCSFSTLLSVGLVYLPFFIYMEIFRNANPYAPLMGLNLYLKIIQHNTVHLIFCCVVSFGPLVYITVIVHAILCIFVLIMDEILCAHDIFLEVKLAFRFVITVIDRLNLYIPCPS